MVMMSYYPGNDPHHRALDNTGGSSVGNGGGGGGHGGHDKSGGAEDDFPVPPVWRMLQFHKYICSFYKRQ